MDICRIHRRPNEIAVVHEGPKILVVTDVVKRVDELKAVVIPLRLQVALVVGKTAWNVRCVGVEAAEGVGEASRRFDLQVEAQEVVLSGRDGEFSEVVRRILIDRREVDAFD